MVDMGTSHAETGRTIPSIYTGDVGVARLTAPDIFGKYASDLNRARKPRRLPQMYMPPRRHPFPTRNGRSPPTATVSATSCTPVPDRAAVPTVSASAKAATPAWCSTVSKVGPTSGASAAGSSQPTSIRSESPAPHCAHDRREKPAGSLGGGKRCLQKGTRDLGGRN